MTTAFERATAPIGAPLLNQCWLQIFAVWLRRKIRENQNVISRKEQLLEQVKGGSHLQDWLFEERLQAEIDVWAVATDDLRELLDMLTHNMEDNI